MEIKKIDFLAIGDVAIDSIIKIKDAHVHCKLDNNACELCVAFGSKIPYESVNIIEGIGNSANAAICASRFGITSAIIANVGDEKNGLSCIEALKKENVITDYISIQKNKTTNYHFVLWFDKERTILVKHTEFDFYFPDLSDIKASYIYLSSTSINTKEYYEKIEEYLDNNKETKLVFQPGTTQIKLGTEFLKGIYAKSDIFFSNKEEAKKILNKENQEISFLELAKGIESLGPKIIFITDGENGAYYYENNELFHLPIFDKNNPVLEITGAGDAFSATIISAIIKGLNTKEAFLFGPINSMSVVKFIGPKEGLLSQEKIEEILKNKPEEYKITKIN